VKAGAYDLVTVVFDFAPGSGVPKHVHGGPVVVTVLSGEMTLQQGGGEKVVKAGESWTEKPGDVHAVVNKSEGITRVAVSLLLPKGAAATTLVK
jgi:quercetin dioxygenase-like cupin family protein